METTLQFRVDDEAAGALDDVAARGAQRRSRSDELRSALDAYLDLHELVRVADPETKMSVEIAAATIHHSLYGIGGSLYAAAPESVRNAFERAAKVEYPIGRIGRIDIPFEKFVPWLLGYEIEDE